MYNHNKAQQSKNRVHIPWDILYCLTCSLYGVENTTTAIPQITRQSLIKLPILIHWCRDNMATISQTTLSNAFSWMKILEFWLKFHWSLFIWVQLTIFQHWFRWWLGADQATSHYLNQWWVVYWRIYASLGFNQLMDQRGGNCHWCNKIIHQRPFLLTNNNLV